MMLNVWVCDDYEDQVEEEPKPDFYPPPQRMDKRWEPYDANMVPRQTAGSIYGNESTRSTDARLLQLPVVSTGGSVLDTRSHDYDRGSAAGSMDMPSMRRNFYKRAQQQHQQQQQPFITAPPTANNFGQNFSHYHQASDCASSIYNQCQQYQPVNNGNYCNTFDHSNNSNSVHNQYHQQSYTTPATCSQYSYNDHEATRSHVHYGNESSYEYNQHEPQPQSQSHYGSYANVDTQWTEPASQYTSNYDLGPSNSSNSVEPAAEEQPAPTSPSKEDSIADSTQFQDQYQILCLFSKTYGHTNVPKVKSWFLLGSWVEKLRKRKKFQMLKERGITVASASNQHPPLSDHELGILEDIGFNWNAPSEEENDEILAKMKEIDNSIVEQASSRTRKVDLSPESTESSEQGKDGVLSALDGVKLENTYSMDGEGMGAAGAVSSETMTKDPSPINFSPLKCKRAPAADADLRIQKKGRKIKKTSSAKAVEPVSHEVAAEENESGESETMVEQMWNTQYKKLAEFKRIHGNCAVPARNPDDPKLGHWVMTQRRQYNLMQKGKQSRMTKERIEMLEQLEFQWSIRTNPKEMWNKRLQELVEYKMTHGDCLVPQRFNENPQLGTWVNTQRRHYKLLSEGKRSCMTEERLQRLNEVGFSWSTSSSGVVKAIREVEEEEDDITSEDLDFV